MHPIDTRRCFLEVPVNVWAYVFITTHQPKKVVRAVRQVPGVLHADALLGSPDVIAIVEGADVGSMDAVIDRIAEVPDIAATDSKVARWIDGKGAPAAGARPA